MLRTSTFQLTVLYGSLFAVAISRERAADAVAWAERIDDPDRQQSAYVAIARRWREQDPPAAEAWLEASPLSEEAREAARSPSSR